MSVLLSITMQSYVYLIKNARNISVNSTLTANLTIFLTIPVPNITLFLRDRNKYWTVSAFVLLRLQSV